MPDVDELDQAAADELWELLTPSQQAAVARGDIDLAELLERVTRPGEELCPWCVTRPITRKRLGTCEVCARRRMRDAQEQVLVELQLHRERDAIKQRIRRERDRQDPDRPRRVMRSAASKTAEDYGRTSLYSTSAPDTVPCFVCGRQHGKHGSDLCPDCEERLERRAAISAKVGASGGK